MNKRIFLWLPFLACALHLDAKVTLPQLFQNGMVLQRNKLIPVWGKADAGETVTVTLNKKKVVTTADSDGRWRVDLPQMKAGGPYTMEGKSEGVNSDEMVLSDVLIGDVWLLSGQSNIDVTIERVYPWYTKDIDSYENPNVRLFRVQNETDTHGVRDDIRPTSINWKPVTKQNAGCSARAVCRRASSSTAGVVHLSRPGLVLTRSARTIPPLWSVPVSIRMMNMFVASRGPI